MENENKNVDEIVDVNEELATENDSGVGIAAALLVTAGLVCAGVALYKLTKKALAKRKTKEPIEVACDVVDDEDKEDENK